MSEPNEITNPVFDREEITHIANAKAKLESALSGAGVFDCMQLKVSDDGDREAITHKLQPDQRHNIVIAGGVMASLISNEKVNDIDVFILNSKESLFNSLIRFKGGKWDIRYQLNEDENYYNPHVIATATNKESKVQYILTDFTSRQDMLRDFDFLHCTCSYHNDQLFISRETYDAIVKKHLICQNKKKKPKDWRLQKFLSRGWTDHTNPDYKLITIFDQAIERAMVQKSAEIYKKYEWPTTSMGAEYNEKAWKELFEKDKEKWKMKEESSLPDYWKNIVREL